jgi:hypothetical protein
MKTQNEITKLNFNDIAFFNEISTTDAKWSMAHHLFGSEKHLEENLNKSGSPKISNKEYLDKALFESEIKSNSELDGINRIDYTISIYNKGVNLNKLREFSETKAFINALKFTGKYTIINEILQDEQLLKLQKSWLLANTYLINRWSKNTVLFIKKYDWSIEYLESKGISKDSINSQLKDKN